MMIGFVDFIVDEGVRPKPPQEIRRDKLTELSALHPEATYAVTAGNPEFIAPLYLPREGEGKFYVIYDRQLVAARVWDIVWAQDSFTASVEGPNGRVIELKGQVGADGSIATTLGETPFNGRLHRPQQSTSTSGG
jgi:hypothetical protein